MKNVTNDRPVLFLKFTLITCCFIFFSMTSYGQKAKDKLLDGKIYTVELTVQGGKKAPKPIPDELTFKADKFKSKAMATESKFTPALYTIAVDSSSSEHTISFDCESKNPDGELLHWVGTITGEAIEGKATLSKKEKVKKEYVFSGSLKTKKK